MKLLRSLYESWLFEATQGELSSWRRSLLARALRRDEGLRCLAYELAEFNVGQVPEDLQAPDLVGSLRARIAAEPESFGERPLFPSAWIPAGAIAVLLITAWVALEIHPSADVPRGSEESSAAAPQALEIPAPASSHPALAAVPKAASENLSSSASAGQSASALSKTAGLPRPLTAPAQ